jgi:hypothetical protein
MGVMGRIPALTCIHHGPLEMMGKHAITHVQLTAMKTKSIVAVEWIGMAAGWEVIVPQVGMNALLPAVRLATEIHHQHTVTWVMMMMVVGREVIVHMPTIQEIHFAQVSVTKNVEKVRIIVTMEWIPTDAGWEIRVPRRELNALLIAPM